VLRRSNKWSIRRTLTAAKHAVDAVVGPETGVLNSVSGQDVQKIVYLSHSSHENLTRDWVNTTVLTAAETPCYPCHQMHYMRCPNTDEKTTQAKCAVNIHWHEFSAALLGEMAPARIHLT
jgi:hypothetical protein